MNRKGSIYHRVNDLEIGRKAEALAGGFEEIHKLTRRRLLRGGLAALGAAAVAPALGLLSWPKPAKADQAVKTGQFIFPRLQFSVYDNTQDIWNVWPVGDANLRKKLSELTNINVSTELKVVRLADFDDMVRHPFVFMTSEGLFRLPENERKNLREFLERGGFIYADDCVAGGSNQPGTGDRFFSCYCKLINELFPGDPMRDVPKDHELFNIYYEFRNGCPHLQGVRYPPTNCKALFEKGTGRLMTVATPGDLHCGWTGMFSGNWGKDKDMEALKMGINIVIYFLSH